MANTYTSLHYHFTFSTKNREPWITIDIENRVWAYIGGVARAHKMTALQVGGMEDHIHAVVMAPPTLSPSEIAQYLKGVLQNGFMGSSQSCVCLNGKMAMVDLQLASLSFQISSHMFRLNAHIIERRHFRKSIWSC